MFSWKLPNLSKHLGQSAKLNKWLNKVKTSSKAFIFILIPPIFFFLGILESSHHFDLNLSIMGEVYPSFLFLYWGFIRQEAFCDNNKKEKILTWKKIGFWLQSEKKSFSAKIMKPAYFLTVFHVLWGQWVGEIDLSIKFVLLLFKRWKKSLKDKTTQQRKERGWGG